MIKVPPSQFQERALFLAYRQPPSVSSVGLFSLSLSVCVCVCVCARAHVCTRTPHVSPSPYRDTSPIG